jgi:hypothetical protein
MESNTEHNSAWDAFIEDGHRLHLNGCHREAELIYKTGFDLAKQARVFLHTSTARVLSLLGDLYAEQQHYVAGENMYRLALLVYEHIDGVEPIDTAITLKRISEMCRLQDKITEALDLSDRAEVMITAVRARLDLLFKKLVAEN